MINRIDVSVFHPMRFERGRSYCVEAASGVGKSSLLHFIGGFRKDYKEGCVLLDGRDIRSFSIAERAVLYRTGLAFVFQDLRLFPNLTALENVQIVNKQTSFRTEESVKELFERLDLGGRLGQEAGLLSWGQQQRVAFIRALCQPCSFLLMDEPVSHLDDNNIRNMADILTEEQAKRQFGVVVTSLGKTLPITFHSIERL